jgi:hypothetical protein
LWANIIADIPVSIEISYSFYLSHTSSNFVICSLARYVSWC